MLFRPEFHWLNPSFLTNLFLLKKFLKKFVHKKSVSVDIAAKNHDYVIPTVWIAWEAEAVALCGNWRLGFPHLPKEAVMLESPLSHECLVHNGTHFYKALWVSLTEWEWRWQDSVMIAVSVQRPLSFLVFTLPGCMCGRTAKSSLIFLSALC